jgi:hypothetical protein
MKPEFLENLRRRTHFMIQAKRTLGHWVPQTGPLDEDPIPRKLHQLINARAGISTKPDPVVNLMTQLARTKNIAQTLEIYMSPSVTHHKRVMKARKIAYRLGLIEERADINEKNRWSEASFKKWTWVANVGTELANGLYLRPGTEVHYQSGGRFSIGDIMISAEETRNAHIGRHKRGHPIR